MGRLDVPTLWRAALVQLAAVALLSLALGLALPHDFFTAWGWLAGPASWMLCAAFTARILSLPLLPTLTGAVLAGLPSLLAVLVGLHWAAILWGVVILIGLALVARQRFQGRRLATSTADYTDEANQDRLTAGQSRKAHHRPEPTLAHGELTASTLPM